VVVQLPLAAGGMCWLGLEVETFKKGHKNE